MPSLRALGMRIALVFVVLATAVSSHMAVAKPQLPFALLDSIDRAFAVAYEAAERKVARLETATPAAPRRDVFAMLRDLEGFVAAACDAASTRLDIELAVAGSLSAERRGAVLGCIERNLADARRSRDHASDPEERAEYSATCERLREIRRLV